MIDRTYQLADDEFFQRSRTVRQHFLNNKAAFVNMDADFDDPFAADWLSSIEASEGTETAETRQDQQQQETADVEAVMQQARDAYTDMKYYIEKADFTPSIRNKFGLDNYDKARDSQAKMVPFLKNMATQSAVAAQAAALTAANCPAALITSLTTIANLLSTEDTQQNTFIDQSPQATQARITQYNETDQFWIKVNRASKSLYKNDAVMANLFKRPHGSQSSDEPNVTGTVKDLNTGNVLEGASVKVQELDITDITNPLGEFSFVSLPPGNYILETTLAGYEVETTPITVAATGLVVSITLKPV